jgi:hypothetical protein
MSRVASRIPDKRVLKLIRAFLNAGVLEDGLVRPVERATHCAESPRQVQRPNPGNHMPDARVQFAADDRRPHAIPHRMARVLRLLPDPARANELEAWIRRRLRLYLWRQWRNGHNRFTELRRFGIAKFAASVAAGSPTGLWRMSGHPAVQHALRNHVFDSLGLPRIFMPVQA